MRVSDRLRYDSVNNRVADAKGQNMDQLDRLATQKDIRNLSDDPIGASQVIRFRDTIQDLRQYQKNIDYSKGMLERSEASLSSVTDNLIRAKELAIGMANDTYDASSREAASREVREILDELVQLGNTTFNGRYIFGGFRNQTPPLSQEGGFLGDDGAIFLQISKGNFRQVNLQARGLFEAAPEDRAKGRQDMLHTIDVLYQGLASNNKDMIHNSIDQLDFQMEKTTSNQATLGSIWKSLSDTQDRLNAEEILNRTKLSNTQDADMYDATSEFKRTETVLQGTLMASTKLLQPSLLNFLQ